MEMDPLAEVQAKSEVVEPMSDLIMPMKIEADHDAFENFMSSFQENSTETKVKKKDFDNYCNIDIGTENLIHVMENHPGLWDPRHLDYPNKQKRDTEWLKVADELFPNWNFMNETQDVLREIKKRWRNTRDSYKKDKVNRDHADDPTKRKRRRYIFSKQLSFLDPVLQFKEFNRSSNANMMSSMMSGFEDGPQFIVDKYDLDYSPKLESDYASVDGAPSATAATTSSFAAQPDSPEFDQSLPSSMSSSGQNSNSRSRNHKRNHGDRNLQEFNHFLSARKKSRSVKTENNSSGGGGGGGRIAGSSHHNPINNNNSAISQNSMNCSSSNNNGNANIGQNSNSQNAFAVSHNPTAHSNSGGNMWKAIREDDEDRYFLLSLLNDIKKVPEHRKLQLKTELLLSIQKYQNLDAESTNSGNVTYLNGFEFEQDMRECYTSSNSESSESMFVGDNDEQ